MCRVASPCRWSATSRCARANNASAIVSSTVTLADRQVSPGGGVSIGLGGFGYGGGSGNVSGGVGVGVSMPVGGGQVSNAYAADTRITSAGTGRMLWSGKASSPASRNVGEQMTSLARIAASKRRTRPACSDTARRAP